MPALTNADRQRLYRQRRAEAAGHVAPAAAVVTAAAPGDVERASNDAAGAPPIATAGDDLPALRYAPSGGAPAQTGAALGNDRVALGPAAHGDDDPAGGGGDVSIALCPAELARLDSWRACQPGHPGRAAALRLLVLAALHMPATA